MSNEVDMFGIPVHTLHIENLDLINFIMPIVRKIQEGIKEHGESWWRKTPFLDQFRGELLGQVEAWKKQTKNPNNEDVDIWLENEKPRLISIASLCFVLFTRINEYLKTKEEK